jgi:hypothetical protein
MDIALPNENVFGFVDYLLDVLNVTNGARLEVYWLSKLNLMCCVTDICQ